MEPKDFTLFFLIAIYQVIIFKPVYNTNNPSDNSTREEDNATISTGDGNITTTVTVENNTNGNASFTETLIDNTTDTVTMIDNTTTTTSESTTNPTINLPKLPETFQARLRLSIVSYNLSGTYNVIVSYDLSKNRAALTKDDGQSRNRQIYDFTQNRILNSEDNPCFVEEISENSTEDIKFLFPFNVNNGVKELKGPLSFFRLDENNTEMADRNILVSGVPCVEYNTAIDFGHTDDCEGSMQCNIRQFYSNPEWRNPNCPSRKCYQMPIRAEAECGVSPLLGDYCHYLRVTVSFLEFYEEIKDEEEFQQPPGVFCENATSEPFPNLSYSFQATLTEINVLGNSLKTEKIWWSESANLLRVDTIVENNDIVSIIADYNRNLSYRITRLGTACGIVPHYENKSPILSFLVGSKGEDRKRIQKVGKRKCGLSECEVWTGETNIAETFDIYLSKPSSTKEDNYEPIFVDLFKSGKIPVRYARRTVSSHSSAVGEWSVFDISPCFAEGSGTRFELSIKGDIGEKWKRSSFRENIYKNIWNYSKIISPLRLQELQIDPETNEAITVRGKIVDDTPMARKISSSYKDISSEDALKNIQTISKQERVLDNDEGYQLKLTDFRIKEERENTGGKKYGPGDMGGLAVGMLLIGVTSGAAVVLLIIRIRMTRKK